MSCFGLFYIPETALNSCGSLAIFIDSAAQVRGILINAYAPIGAYNMRTESHVIAATFRSCGPLGFSTQFILKTQVSTHNDNNYVSENLTP